MGVLINHSISFVTSPLSVALALLVVGFLVSWKWRRVGLSVVGLGLVWLYCLSSGWMYAFLSLGLERQFPPQRVEELPKADAVVVLGGGVGANTNTLYYSELYMSADRVVHAARIWKAGKAPVVITSGSNEVNASRPFLLELGVPEAAILVENKSGNTEENARFVADYVRSHHLSRPQHGYPSQPTAADSRQPTADSTNENSLPRILLVTSSWHMRRSLLMFRKYAPELEVVPAAIDYESTLSSDNFSFVESLLPGAEALMRNSYMVKEIIGYWGYRLLR